MLRHRILRHVHQCPGQRCTIFLHLSILGAAVPSAVATRSRSQDDAVLIKPLDGDEHQLGEVVMRMLR